MGISVIGGSASGGGSAGINFYVSVEATGSLSDLGTDYPAGGYRIVSAAADNAYDIYLITSSNQLVGYGSGRSVTASAPFSKVFILGGEVGDLITFEFATVATGAASTGALGAAPFVTNVPDVTLPNLDDTVTVSGGNFDANTQVAFLASDGVTELSAKNVSVTDSATIVVTRPDVFPGDYYKIKVSKTGIPLPSATQQHISTTTVAPGAVPVWSTAATLPAISNGTAYTTTLVANDPDNQTPLTYSVVSGSLPTGLSLDGATGVVSGTPSGLPANPTEGINVTIAAEDSVGMSAERNFVFPQLVMEIFNASNTFTVPTGVSTLSYEVVSGGGSTAAYNSSSYQLGCGGGGAGGFVSGSAAVSANDAIVVTIGAGGAQVSPNQAGNGSNGSNSTVTINGNTLVDVEGGGYASCWGQGGNGACGGGTRNSSGGIGSIGYNGGTSSSQYSAGGGGGMGSAGSTPGSSYQGGTGGTGVYMIDGSAVCGGGAGNSPYGAAGSASFGGGAGSQNGAANTGGGGGGVPINTNQPTGKYGGSGKVILYYEVGGA